MTDVKADNPNKVLDCLQSAATPLSGVKISVRLNLTEVETLEAIKYLENNGLIVRSVGWDSSAAKVDEILRFWQPFDPVAKTEGQ
ncbi:MAG: hypothetical protein V4690_04365 [Patescibacteria group bacterium]